MDPAAAVNKDTGEANPYLSEVAADPRPFYRELRTACPVAAFEGFGPGTWIVSRFEDVRYVLRHPEIFSSDIVAVDIGQERPLIPLQIDPPEHAKYRRVIDPTLGPHEIAPLETEVRKLVNELIDSFIDRGEVDAHAEFTVPLPCTVFLQLCGLPLEDLDRLLAWKDGIIRPDAEDPDEAARIRRETGAEMYAYFGAALDEREGAGGDDLFTRFFTSEVDGRRMTREEMLDICYLFILGGLDTVTSTLDCSLAYLAEYPQHRQALSEDPTLVPAAVEELLRLHTPVMQVLRAVVQPTELHGVKMNPGDTVMVMLGAADTDPSEFGGAADDYDVSREANRHLAFGGGPHRCLGSHLARFELRLALEEWHRRIVDYRVADGAELVYSPGIREIAEFPLVFTAASDEEGDG